MAWLPLSTSVPVRPGLVCIPALLLTVWGAPALSQGGVTADANLTAGAVLNGGDLGLRAGINGAVSTATRNTTLSANGSAAFTLGAGDLDPAINGSVRLTRALSPRATGSLGLNYAHSPFNFVGEDLLIDPVEALNGSGTRTRWGITSSLSYELDSRTSASLGLRYDNTDYDPVTIDLVPNENTNLDFGISRALDSRTRAGLDARLGWYTSDTAAQIESLTASLNANASHEVNTRTTLDGGLGVAFVNTEETGGGVRTDSWTTTLLFDAGATIDYIDGAMRIGFSQEVAPGTGGELRVNSTLSGDLTYELNPTTTLGLSGALQRQSALSGGDALTVLQVSPSYAMEVVEGLNAEVSYTLRSGEGNTDHRFGFNFSRALDVLP